MAGALIDAFIGKRLNGAGSAAWPRRHRSMVEVSQGSINREFFIEQFINRCGRVSGDGQWRFSNCMLLGRLKNLARRLPDWLGNIVMSVSKTDLCVNYRRAASYNKTKAM
jgi:hypothetical protein